MSAWSVLLISLGYVLLLFGVAWWVERSTTRARGITEHPWLYSLTMAVYCTAWTFYGSVGRASNAGLGFLAVYLGPALFAPLWYMVLYKMILISKNERVASVADFISSRYSKSPTVGVVVTMLVVLGLIPYISIQIQAVTAGSQILLGDKSNSGSSFALMITAAMALFAGVFGTRKLDPNERHEGLMASIALESIVKLVAFLVVGVVVTFGLYHGFADLFDLAAKSEKTARLFTLHAAGISPSGWFCVMLLSLFAFVLLPRQFHVSVVENSDARHVRTAMWLVPFYLLLINIFVFPIALAGKMTLGDAVHPDSYVLSLPLAQGLKTLAVLVFIGGFSAAISMVVVETMALSIMMSNYLFVPLLLKFGTLGEGKSGNRQLLNIRRLSIVLILIGAYLYEHYVTFGFDIVSIGLISFAAVAQLAPATFGGMYWKRGNQQGALAGLIGGFLVWAFCLPLPYMSKAGIISGDFVEFGLMGIGWLKPYALFGLNQFDPITHGTFWSLMVNVVCYAVVSEWTSTDAVGLQQADRFVNVQKYTTGQLIQPLHREADLADVRMVLVRFLGAVKTEQVMKEYMHRSNIKNLGKKAPASLINFAELQLTGVLGTSSARLVINGISELERVSFEEVIHVLEQTREALEHSKLMEAKNMELSGLTDQLRDANLKLLELDKLKADFITSVTHELRTPITSILAFSQILQADRKVLPEEKTKEYLDVIVQECKRIGRLVNQVLDLEKVRSDGQAPMEWYSMQEILSEALRSTSPLFDSKDIGIDVSGVQKFAEGALINKDQMLQVVINLLANAAKFCPPQQGRVILKLTCSDKTIALDIEDNGPGISAADEARIFDQFFQAKGRTGNKPEGAGLGLYICTQIMARHNGSISVTGRPGLGAIFHVTLPVNNIG
jgi:Na+/proline symporter/signal transduction histidine kinase